MTRLGAMRVLATLAGAVLAFGSGASASAATCGVLAGERVVAESRTAVVIEGGTEPERESSGEWDVRSYYACLRSVGRRVRVGYYHGGPLIELWLGQFAFSGHYLTFVDYFAPGNPGGTGVAVEQYDLATGRRAFVDKASEATVRGSLSGGPPLVASSIGDAAWITEDHHYTALNELVWTESVVVHAGSKTETFATYGPIHTQKAPVLNHPLIIGLRITQRAVSWVHNGRTTTKALRWARLSSSHQNRGAGFGSY
jgi:hypothetical protein